MNNVKHLIDSSSMDMLELLNLLDLASDISKNEEKYSEKCKNKILANLFYEPSTRTRLSFTSAMLKLGGEVIGFSDSNSSSVSKGESLSDTIRTINCYSDIIAIRHPNEGSAKYAAEYSSIPIINAGDGGHYHPTQTITDLLTIKEIKGRLDNLTIGLCGDLKFGRTAHSLIKTLSKFNNVKFILISPEELGLPSYVKNEINSESIVMETTNLEENINKLDVLYMTRVQKERFFNEHDYIRLKNTYILTQDKLKSAKDDLTILHPLPRVGEIDSEVDSDERACYFKQVKFGLYARMAIIMDLLEVGK